MYIPTPNGSKVRKPAYNDCSCLKKLYSERRPRGERSVTRRAQPVDPSEAIYPNPGWTPG